MEQSKTKQANFVSGLFHTAHKVIWHQVILRAAIHRPAVVDPLPGFQDSGRIAFEEERPHDVRLDDHEDGAGHGGHVRVREGQSVAERQLRLAEDEPRTPAEELGPDDGRALSEHDLPQCLRFNV